MQAIPITSIPGIRIGQAQDEQGGTGITVLLCPQGAPCGIDVRGGGPASRDTRILDPLATCEAIHAVVLAGGSAFGLDAAGGVMRYLEERGIGVAVGDARVPLVCQSDIFDLAVGSAAARPTADMAYDACVASEQGNCGNYQDGNAGAGCGATVGKLRGMACCMKSGIGSYAVQLDSLIVGAVVVVNALGDVVDPATGRIVAGLLAPDKQSFADSETALLATYESAGAEGVTARVRQTAKADASPSPSVVANTTIGAIITNAALTKAQLSKVASMGHDGMARAVRPVHSSIDGDSLYALSVGDVPATPDVVGCAAAHVVEKAILAAVRSAKSAFGLPSVQDLGGNPCC